MRARRAEFNLRIDLRPRIVHHAGLAANLDRQLPASLILPRLGSHQRAGLIHDLAEELTAVGHEKAGFGVVNILGHHHVSTREDTFAAQRAHG